MPSPFFAKEQARKDAKTVCSQYVILSNKIIHNFWDVIKKIQNRFKSFLPLPKSKQSEHGVLIEMPNQMKRWLLIILLLFKCLPVQNDWQKQASHFAKRGSGHQTPGRDSGLH